jgi:predicted transcriptional regulator
MEEGFTASIRMPEEVRDLYETLAQATGRAKNDLMVEALRVEGQRRVDEIAMILEGRVQARAGRLSPIGDVVARFKAGGMLPADFDLDSARASDLIQGEDGSP